MPVARLEMFRSELNLTEVQPGEVIFTEGDHAEDMFVVVEGEVEITKDGTVIDRAEPGDAVGELALINEAPRSATVTATTESRLARVSKARFESLVAENPFFALDVMEQMAERLLRQTSA
jgi:CRP-like cAMP-binding protein